MKKFYKLLFICLLILSGGMALKAQTYNDSDSEYANRAEVPTYISKIAVAYGAKESTPKDILKDNGFTVIDYDLNKGCGSTTHYIYMGYKTTQNPSEAITGIFFRTGENPPASATFDGVTAYLLGGNGESNPGENTYVDLNADAGGSYIYTYVTRDASRAAVLQGLYFNSSNSASGCVTPNVNLNSGTGGSAIYLHYQQFSGKASATFHYLNANGSRTSSSTSVSVKHHQQAVNNTPSAPSSISYDGKTFALIGWREDNTATTAGSTPSYTYMDSKVYRAVYSVNVSLIYNANGGSGAPSTQNATQYINAGSSSIAISNVSITIPATIPTHDATKCNFSGWSTSSSATTAQYQPGNNISINTNTTLYAVWPEHNGTKTYVNIGETHTYTWSCCGKTVTEDHIYDNGIDHYCGAHIHEIDENGYCDLCDGYPATLVDGYYQINNANELLWFAEYVNSIDKTASAKLMNDIEMNAVQWTPIGTSDAYNGTFDGQGHTINNLWHNTGVADGGREGLFTLIGSNGVVKNIVLNNATIWGGSSYGFNSCGGIAIKNQGTISNCIIAGSTIQFGNYAHFGGITGHNTGTIKNCAVRNSILRRRWGGVNNRNLGGITQTNNGTVTDCYSYDNIYEYGLTTCAISAEGNAPINSYQYTTSTVADAAETAKTKEQFASGEVAYLLQGEQATQVWGQNIDNGETADSKPILGGAKVYEHTFDGTTLYSNSQTLTAGGKCGDKLYWNIDDENTLTIFGTGAMYNYGNSINKAPWRSLNPAPTSLVLEDGITHIGNSAFYQCSGFTGSLTIPNSVTTIGGEAFEDCKGFTGSLTIPNSVTAIGNYAFEDCYGFTGSLTIGNSVTSIGGSAFYYCKGFTGSLTIPNSVTSIGRSAFRDCKGFTGSLTIPNSVTTIGNEAFRGCSGFTGSLTIPNSVTYIGDEAFYYCKGFTGSLTIPNSVTTIGGYAFYNCKGFTGSLTIGNSVTTIGDFAFQNCSGFNGSLTIPNSVTYIGNYAFQNCSGFNGSLTIPNSVTTIGEGAFKYCSGLTGSLTIGNSVTTIGESAFRYCSGFTGSLTIPNSVTTIGLSAFYDCSGFTGSLTIGNSVTTIGGYAFYNCKGFTEVYSLAETAPTLGENAFNKPNNATLYYPASSEPSYNNKGWFNYFSKCIGFNGKCGDNLYWKVSNDVLTIFGTGAMYDYGGSSNKAPWRSLTTAPTSLVLEEGITTIGANAFYNCSGLTGSLTIPNSVTTIGNSAFYQCSGFDGSLTIGNSVTSIGNKAFEDCEGFTGDLTIGNSVTTIGNYAFYQCSGFDGSLTIGNSVTTIGNYAFDYCSGFTGSLTIPNSVTTIGNYAFSFCYGFTGDLTIPNSVTAIGNYAFYNCYGLSEIFFYRDTNPTIGSDAFYNISSTAKIYAPVIWESFDNIPEDKLVKMATYTSQQDNETTSQQVWVFPEGMTEVGEDDHVAINAPMVLGSLQDYKNTRLQGSEANSLWVKSFGYCGNGTTVNGSITIEDGGELYCEIARGEVTVKKDIIGYAETTRLQDNETTSETVWYTIASPLKDTLLISDSQFLNSSVPQFLSSNSDLYRYDEPSYTWQNAKNSANNGFNTIDPGRGYLYANAEDTTLEFTGMINTDEVTYSLTTDGNVLKGFHLIGNPFTHNITFAHLNATEGAELVNGYYVLNGEGAWGATLGSNEDDVIKPGQGVLVKAKTEGTLAIAKSQRRRDAESQSRGQQDNRTTRQQVLEMSVSNAKYSDRAFVVFDKGVGLDKMNHENENIPLLYIPMEDADYAIAMMDINVNEIPVSFETNVMGEYTISLRQENCEFSELYLLDKETDEKVNILEQDYTFIATSNDAPERFVLLKDNGQQSTDNSHFAYVNNGDIVIYDINGDADIRIFDALGRCVYQGESSDETTRIANGYSSGVYMIQKADDKGVNVQKIIL